MKSSHKRPSRKLHAARNGSRGSKCQYFSMICIWANRCEWNRIASYLILSLAPAFKSGGGEGSLPPLTEAMIILGLWALAVALTPLAHGAVVSVLRLVLSPCNSNVTGTPSHQQSAPGFRW